MYVKEPNEITRRAFLPQSKAKPSRVKRKDCREESTTQHTSANDNVGSGTRELREGSRRRRGGAGGIRAGRCCHEVRTGESGGVGAVDDDGLIAEVVRACGFGAKV